MWRLVKISNGTDPTGIEPVSSLASSIKCLAPIPTILTKLWFYRCPPTISFGILTRNSRGIYCLPKLSDLYIQRQFRIRHCQHNVKLFTRINNYFESSTKAVTSLGLQQGWLQILYHISDYALGKDYSLVSFPLASTNYPDPSANWG